MANHEDLVKELEYYTKLIHDFKGKQNISAESLACTNGRKTTVINPSSATRNKTVTTRNSNGDYIKATRYSLKKLSSDPKTDVKKTGHCIESAANIEKTQKYTECNKDDEGHHGLHSLFRNKSSSYTVCTKPPEKFTNPYKFTKEKSVQYVPHPQGSSKNSVGQTLSHGKQVQLLKSKSSPELMKLDTTVTKKQTELSHTSGMFLNHGATDKDHNVCASPFDGEIQNLNPTRGFSGSLAETAEVSQKHTLTKPMQKVITDSVTINSVMDKPEYFKGPVSSLSSNDISDHSVVRKSRYKLVKQNTAPVQSRTMNQKSVKHYGPHKMVRKLVYSKNSSRDLSKHHFVGSMSNIKADTKRKLVTKHKVIKIGASIINSTQDQSRSFSRCKSWHQPILPKMSSSEIAAQKLVRSYQRRSLVRSRYKFVKETVASDGKELHVSHKKVPRCPSYLMHRKKLGLPGSSTNMSRRPRKSKYSIVKSETDPADGPFDINRALGRSVLNISKNKYKFIKPNARSSLRKRPVRKLQLGQYSRRPAKSPGKKPRTSYVILRGHLYRKAKHGIVKVGPSSSGVVNRKKTPKKIPDVNKKKTSTLKTARHMVVRSIATVVQNKFKRDHRQTLSPRKRLKYCLYYNRFGKCSRGNNCPFIHDPDKVAVCTRFIRGTCQVTDCPFSHKVTKEKMPVCRYFMKGSCVNEHCPYLHVNVGKHAQVCEDFLNGYCAAGDKCKKKHTLICPDYETSGKCPRHNSCKLKHVRKTVKRKQDYMVRSTLEEDSVKKSKRAKVPSTLSQVIPEDFDDVNLPMKERNLPAFISILSPEETPKSVAVTGYTESNRGTAKNGRSSDDMEKTQTKSTGTRLELQIRPNLTEEESLDS